MDESNYCSTTVELQYINDSTVKNIDFKKQPAKPKIFIIDRYESLVDQINLIHQTLKAPFDPSIAALQIDNNHAYLSLQDSLRDHDAYKDIMMKRESIRLILRTNILYRCNIFIDALKDEKNDEKSEILKSISNSVYRDEEFGYQFLMHNGLKVLVKSIAASPANIIELLNCISHFLLFGGSIDFLSCDKMFISWLYGILRCRDTKVAIKVVKIYEIMIKFKGGKSEFIVENILEVEKESEKKFVNFIDLLKLKNMELCCKEILSFLIFSIKNYSKSTASSDILASLEKQGLSVLTSRIAKSNNTALINLCANYRKLKNDKLKVVVTDSKTRSLKNAQPPAGINARAKLISRKMISNVGNRSFKLMKDLDKKSHLVTKESQRQVNNFNKKENSGALSKENDSKRRKRIGDLFNAMDNHFLGDYDFSELTENDDVVKLILKNESANQDANNTGPPPPPPGFGAAPPNPPPCAPKPPGAPPSLQDKAKSRDQEIKCVQLFWGSLDRTKLSKYFDLTIWSKLLKKVVINEQEIIALFKVKEAKCLNAKSESASKTSKALDDQRYQMVSIVLHKLPTVSEIEASVISLAYEDYSITMLKNIKKVIPTEEEISMIEDYISREEGLSEHSPEKFMFQLSKIPFIRISMDEMLFFAEFEAFEQDNGKLLFELMEAIKEVYRSKCLLQVLSVLMMLGNVVNRRKIKYGFHVNYLSKLALVSDTATKKPILYHVCRILDDNNYKIENPKSEFPTIQQVIKIDLHMIKQEYETIYRTYESLKEAGASCQTDAPGRVRAKNIMEKVNIKLKLFQIVYKRVLNRFKKMALYLGCTEDELPSINIKDFFTMINTFLSDYDFQIKKYNAFKEAEKIQEMRKIKTIERISESEKINQKDTPDGEINELFNAIEKNSITKDVNKIKESSNKSFSLDE